MSLVAVQFVTFNVPMERLKELAIAQMQTGETVWFGSDVGQLSNRKAGILATDVYDFESSMDIQLTQDKAGRLDYSESLMTHAMVLTGVDLDEMVNQLSGKLKLMGRQGWYRWLLCCFRCLDGRIHLPNCCS